VKVIDDREKVLPRNFGPVDAIGPSPHREERRFRAAPKTSL
jgi:hypothetical protein